MGKRKAVRDQNLKPTRRFPTDLKFMRAALKCARAAGLKGEVPVGAVVVSDGRILASAANSPVSSKDPSAHAEILALRKAARKTGNYRLTGAALYVTKEPCAMCAGAIVHARIARLVFGCYDEKSGAAGSVLNVANNRFLNHRALVEGGLMAAECADALKKFFAGRRKKPAKSVKFRG